MTIIVFSIFGISLVLFHIYLLFFYHALIRQGMVRTEQGRRVGLGEEVHGWGEEGQRVRAGIGQRREGAGLGKEWYHSMPSTSQGKPACT